MIPKTCCYVTDQASSTMFGATKKFISYYPVKWCPKIEFGSCKKLK